MNQKGLVSLIIVILILVLLSFGFVYFVQTSQNSNSNHQITSTKTGLYSNLFRYFIPKPISSLTLEDLPNNKAVRGAVDYNGHIWTSGDGSLIEYDPNTHKILSYTDPKQINCDTNLVLIENSIFVACHVDNIEDAFGPAKLLTTPTYTGHYAVLKINPQQHSVERVFGHDEGLLNNYNYVLVGDGESVWVETFRGIGRIDTKTNHVSFYPESQIGVGYGGGSILPDKDYVWAFSIDTGMVLFNRTTQTWRKFTPAETLGRVGVDRLDTRPSTATAAKLVSGGVQLGLYDSNQATKAQNCLIRQYQYSTMQWTTFMTQPVKSITQCEDLLQPYFTPYPTYTVPDQNSLSQLTSPVASQIDGRGNLLLSPVVSGKRYVLTDSTLDVLDESLKFPQILVKFGHPIANGMPYSGDVGSVALLIDPTSLMAVVVQYSCGGEGYCSDGYVWLIDLTAGQTLKAYTIKKFPNPIDLFSLNLWTISRQGQDLLIKDKSGQLVFTIDTTTTDLTLNNSPK